jgi:hypothetical protein
MLVSFFLIYKQIIAENVILLVIEITIIYTGYENSTFVRNI